MAPIHDTDIAEERWTKAEWDNYELWEKIEVRLRRRKRLWILATIVLFLMISAVPIVRDQLPRWRAMSAMRFLAQEINQIKRDANLQHASFRIRFKGEGSLAYQVEKVPTCAEATGNVIRTGELLSSAHAGSFTFLSAQRGDALKIPGLSETFCYDFLAGSETVLKGDQVTGFAVIPQDDLEAGRMDRISVLLVSGASAEISFE